MCTREISQTMKALFSSCVLHCRYRDNIYLCGPLHELPAAHDTLCVCLAGMPVQFEQLGETMSVLELTVQFHPKNQIGIKFRRKCISVEQRYVAPVQRWPDPCSQTSLM